MTEEKCHGEHMPDHASGIRLGFTDYGNAVVCEPILRERPNLGLATTKQLIDELHARADVSNRVGEEWPHYRTVDHA